MRLKSFLSALVGVVLTAPAVLSGQAVHGQAPNVVHYTTTIDNVKYLFATA